MPCGPTAHTCMLTHTYTRMHACARTHTLLTGTTASGIHTSALPGPELQPSTQHPARCPAATRTGPGGAEPHGGLQAGMQPLHPDPPASGSHLRLPQSAHQSISLVPVLAPATSSRRPAGPGKRPRAEFLQEASWLESISVALLLEIHGCEHLTHRGSVASAAAGVQETDGETPGLGAVRCRWVRGGSGWRRLQEAREEEPWKAAPQFPLCRIGRMVSTSRWVTAQACLNPQALGTQNLRDHLGWRGQRRGSSPQNAHTHLASGGALGRPLKPSGSRKSPSYRRAHTHAGICGWKTEAQTHQSNCVRARVDPITKTGKPRFRDAKQNRPQITQRGGSGYEASLPCAPSGRGPGSPPHTPGAPEDAEAAASGGGGGRGAPHPPPPSRAQRRLANVRVRGGESDWAQT